jgi:YD repeat-containing protein
MPGRTSPVGQGSRIRFQASYRQRGAMPESGAIFGLGPQWSCSFRAYLIDLSSEQVGFRLHRGGAGAIDYQVGVMQYWDGSVLSTVTGGYQIEYVDGSIDLFTTTFSDGQRLYYFLATHKDAAGNTTTYSYTGNETAIQLSSITDPDGRVSTLSYTNATYTNQITGVTDPFSRTAILQYDADGCASDQFMRGKVS